MPMVDRPFVAKWRWQVISSIDYAPYIVRFFFLHPYMNQVRTLFLFFILTAGIILPAYAVDDNKPKKKHHNIEQMIPDLTASQRKKIDQIRKESNERIDSMEMRQERIRDSIRIYLDLYEDHRSALYPLMEKEARIRLEINKEMYRAKTQINSVLTKAQHQTLITNMKKNRASQKKESPKK